MGNWREANEELERITPQMRSHPDVLMIRWQIYAKADKWELAAEVGRAISINVPDSPVGYVHMAHALHKLERTKEAYAVLLSVIDDFPDDYTFSYNLARYSCQLGNLKETKGWVEVAIKLGGKKAIRKMALDDPELRTFWSHTGRQRPGAPQPGCSAI